MNYYKARIQYDGTNYCGFQWQKDLRTIQNDFNHALAKLMSGKISTMGSSRTDTGVHAIEQIVKITFENQIECEDFLTKLNLTLPTQIRCLNLNPCPGNFRPATDNISKEYRYLFTNNLRSGGFEQKFMANHPYVLDIDLMMKCSQMIIGRKDFRNFCSAGSNVKSTIRDISDCGLSEIDPRTVLPQTDLFLLPRDLEKCYQFKIEGNGFLKQMVRHLMRALWLVGGGRITPDEFSRLLKGLEKSGRLWKVAPPQGLFLYRITPLPEVISPPASH